MTTDTLTAAVNTATNLPALHTALFALQAYCDEYNAADGHNVKACIGEMVDMSALPTFGDEPDCTLGILSWDATRILWVDGLTLDERDDAATA